MKTFKLSVIMAIVMMAVLLSPAAGQDDGETNYLEELASWNLADFSGSLDQQKVYDIYYDQKSARLEDPQYLCLETISVYTAYGKKCHRDIGVKSRRIALTANIWLIDVTTGKYCLTAYIDVYKSGRISTTVYEYEEWGWTYPKSGSLGDYYVRLAKKIARENAPKDFKDSTGFKEIIL